MENLSANNIALIWLVCGAVFFMLEVAAVPGIGFLFAGFAAITVGGLINFGVLDAAATIPQLAAFFVLTFVWAAVLWLPLLNFRKKSMGNSYQNIVGETAVVACNILYKKKKGKVLWSGTVVNAILDEKDVEETLNKDDEVFIKEVNGNVFTVSSQLSNEVNKMQNAKQGDK